MKKCDWCLGDALNEKYHDEEWGEPIHDDSLHFEYLTLEMMQSGLSWLTILHKREHFYLAFSAFAIEKVAQYTTEDVKHLMNNKGIVRHQKKIESVIENARCFLKIQKEYGSFDDFIWGFVNYKPVINHYESILEVPAKTELSDKISKVLKQKGFKFVGSTTIYAYLQASGIVNDHLSYCFKRRNLNV